MPTADEPRLLVPAATLEPTAATVQSRTTCGIDRWHALADVAVHGLLRTYADESAGLPYTRRSDGNGAICSGTSVRYALISLLGLAKAAALVGPQKHLVASLWTRVARARQTAPLTVGDLGLGLWARAVYAAGRTDFTSAAALAAFLCRPQVCDSAELAWLLLGAEQALAHGLDREDATRLSDVAHAALLRLYNADTGLFYRHERSGVTQRVTRRVACFANQIYPVMAFAVYARRTGDSETAAIARTVAENLCRLQGPLGQWWWLYDVRSGAIVEQYPVFSVHQHGMAPIALLETAHATGRDYSAPIERGLRWLSSENELGLEMVLAGEGLILRDIHKRGVGRVRRAVAATLWCCGRRHPEQGRPPARGFEVNPECRPYELGWLLYAAGLAAQTTATPV